MSGRPRKLTRHKERPLRRLIALRRALSNKNLAKRFGISPSLVSRMAGPEDWRQAAKIIKAAPKTEQGQLEF
jgi:hypothetical protein